MPPASPSAFSVAAAITIITMVTARPSTNATGKAAFTKFITEHRPPSSGACRPGQRWADACRACVCKEGGVLRCEALPCDAPGRPTAVFDGFVMPPHDSVRQKSVHTDHALHSRKGDAAEESGAQARHGDGGGGGGGVDSASDERSHEGSGGPAEVTMKNSFLRPLTLSAQAPPYPHQEEKERRNLNHLREGASPPAQHPPLDCFNLLVTQNQGEDALWPGVGEPLRVPVPPRASFPQPSKAHGRATAAAGRPPPPPNGRHRAFLRGASAAQWARPRVALAPRALAADAGTGTAAAFAHCLHGRPGHASPARHRHEKLIPPTDPLAPALRRWRR